MGSLAFGVLTLRKSRRWAASRTRVGNKKQVPHRRFAPIRNDKIYLRCGATVPYETNEPLQTALVAPMTTTLRNYPMRVTVHFSAKTGQVARDQIRAIDRERLVRELGPIPAKVARQVSDVLLEMFAR